MSRPGVEFGRSVFVCSKPLQVLNCASIVRHYAIADARLHVLTSSISDVDDFARFLTASAAGRQFSTVAWNVDDDAAIEAFTRRDRDSLFIEDDRVGHYRKFVAHRTRSMVVFEEGIGTYRASGELTLTGLRKLKWKVLAATTGCGWDFGEGRATDAVMVSRPDVYRRLKPGTAAKALGFPGLIDEVGRDSERWRAAALDALGRPTGRMGRVALVLARWGAAPTELLAEVAGRSDVVFYKPHPHDGSLVDHPGVVNVAGSWIPAEVFVETLASLADHLTVYHHSSSAAFYLDGFDDDVEFVDLLDSDQLRDVLAASRV